MINNPYSGIFGPQGFRFPKPVNPLMSQMKPVNEMTPGELDQEFANQPSLDDIRRRRAMAQGYANQAGSTAPVSNGWAAASRVLAGVNAGITNAMANRDDLRAREVSNQRMWNATSANPGLGPVANPMNLTPQGASESPAMSLFRRLRGFGNNEDQADGGMSTGGLY
jgi:hypothetical protein